MHRNGCFIEILEIADFVGYNVFEHQIGGTGVLSVAGKARGNGTMMYPYLTLNDQTEITHSEMKEDGSVKVYIETPDENGGFHSAVCWLPEYRWENVQGYTEQEMAFFQQLVRNNAHLMMEFSKEGGFEYASGF